jgi:hypothetical protein
MPIPKINGSLLPQRQSIKQKFDPSGGETTTTEFSAVGPVITENGVIGGLHGLASKYGANGAAYDLSTSRNVSNLVVVETKNIYTPTDEQVQTRWELFANMQALDIKEHPTWANTASDTQRALVLKDVERHNNGKAYVRDWEDIDPFTDARLESFMQLMSRGVTTYQRPQWVIRVTYNVSNEARSTITDAGVGKLYTTAQLGLPEGRIRSTIQSIDAPAAVSGLTWAWLKTGNTEVQAANNRVDVSEEAWLAQWSTLLYELA